MRNETIGKEERLGYLANARQALRDHNPELAGYWMAVAKGCCNPDATELQQHRYRQALESRKWKDAWYPTWLKSHFNARKMPKPFEPDYSCTTAKCPRGHKIPEGCTITATRVYPAMRKAA